MTADYVPNQVELARALGVNRKTVQRWLKLDGNPGGRADGRYHVASWMLWSAAEGKRAATRSHVKLTYSHKIQLGRWHSRGCDGTFLYT